MSRMATNEYIGAKRRAYALADRAKRMRILDEVRLDCPSLHDELVKLCIDLHHARRHTKAILLNDPPLRTLRS